VDIEGEKQEAIETGKEQTKKLSAAAPPFNPSTIPIFRSVPVPGFNDHVGILPPPVNISPLLPRRSLHQSATARVPYGPRISGGYNRHYGNRVPRNKTIFPSGEISNDGNPNSPPTIMNPHASEFVPGQIWVTPNGYITSPNGIPVSPNSFPPISPNDGISPDSPNDIPVNQNEFSTSPSSSNDLAQVENNLQNEKVLDEQVTDALSTHISVEKQPVEQTPQPDPPVSTENCCPKVEEKDIVFSGPTEDEVASKDTVDEVESGKCWGDYSDNEAESLKS
jgi:protein TIF31